MLYAAFTDGMLYAENNRIRLAHTAPRSTYRAEFIIYKIPISVLFIYKYLKFVYNILFIYIMKANRIYIFL